MKAVYWILLLTSSHKARFWLLLIILYDRKRFCKQLWETLLWQDDTKLDRTASTRRSVSSDNFMTDLFPIQNIFLPVVGETCFLGWFLPQKTTTSQKSRVVSTCSFAKGMGHKRAEIFNACLAIPFNEKRFKRRNSWHGHIFFSLKFNKLRKPKKRHLGARRETSK